MTTNTLVKHYGALSAAERLALMMAAGARGEEVEHARLADAAPRVSWRVPRTFGRALAFLGIFTQHRMERLDLAALFFKTSALADTATGQLAIRLRDAVGLYGYVAANAEGWAQFCRAEQLDPALCESVAPGADALECAAREAEIVGFTEDQVRRAPPGWARCVCRSEDGRIGREQFARGVHFSPDAVGVMAPTCGLEYIGGLVDVFAGQIDALAS